MPKKKDAPSAGPKATKTRATGSMTRKPPGQTTTNRDPVAREALCRAIIETSADGFCILDREGRILEVNEAYALSSKYSREELIGMHISELDACESPEDAARHSEKIRRESSDIFETRHRAKDGTIWPVEVNASYYPQGDLFFVHIRDLNKRKHAEMLLAARSRLVALADGEDLSAVMQATLDEAELLTGSRIGFFHFVDEDQEHLTLQAWSTRTLKTLCTAEGKGLHYPISQAGVWVDCFHRRKPVVHDDYANLPHRKGMPEGHAPVTRELTLPVIRGDKVKAIIGVGNKTTPYTEQDVATVVELASLVIDLVEEKKAVEAFSASERRFRTVFEQAAVGIVIIDQARRILDVNPAIIQMLGYGREELVGRHISEISVAEDEASNLRMLEEARSNDQPSFTMEKRYIRKDGRILYGLLTVSLLPPKADAGGDSGEAMVGIIEDITDRKQVEQALMNSEALYRNLVETTAAVAWEVDCATLRFDYISPRIERISGYPPWKWTDFTFWAERIHPEDREEAINFCRAETAKGADHAFTYRMLAADGRVVWIRDVVSVIREEDRPVKLRGYFIDITPAREAEEKIRRSEQLIRAIHDSVDDGFIVVDRDFRITSANRAYCEQNGLSVDQVIGRPCFEISHRGVKPCHEEGETCAVMEVFTSGKSRSALHKHRDASGNLLYVETRAFPLKDASGNVTAAVEVIHNVTERHLLEAERLKTQKLEAIGTLAGGIAHDFNNLLQGVFGYVSMAKLAANRPEKVVEMLDQAEKALSLSVNLTTQLLTFAKGGKPIKKKTRIGPVIENATRFALSGSRCDVTLNLAPDLWMTDVDEGQIAQVIQNIVLNAREAMPEGGTVEVEARNVGLPGEERCIRIAIRDTGIGIPEAYRTKIFDPYFTTKQKGSGLGLATSYSIVKNHGGSIEVASTQNEGTTFTLTLPACQPAEPVAEAIAAAVQGRVSGRRILLMDDEPMVQTVAKNMVEILGHDIEIAGHGEEAIEKYEGALAAAQPFDLVILDLTIKGGMGGEETMRRLIQIDPKVKAVVSSGYADASVMSDYRRLGFSGILGKPYNLKDLRACLNEVF